MRRSRKNPVAEIWNRRESAVMAGVQAYLETRTDVFMWRNNSGGAWLGGAFMKFGKRGSGDWLGLQAVGLPFPNMHMLLGRFVAIECKRERGGAQTADQKRFQRNVELFGGLYILARSVDDVAQALGPCTMRIQKELYQRVIPR